MVGGGAYMLSAASRSPGCGTAIDDDRTGPELERHRRRPARRRRRRPAPTSTLKTAPRGYAKDHPRIDLLRNKGIIGWWEHPPRRWLPTPAARDRVADGWRALGPLNAWLDAHVRTG